MLVTFPIAATASVLVTPGRFLLCLYVILLIFCVLLLGGSFGSGPEDFFAASAFCGRLALAVPLLVYLDEIVQNGESKEWKFHSTFAASVCPKLIVTGDISFTYDGITSEATAGEYLVAPFKLHPGDNVITVSGSGTLTITFREVIL